MNKNAVPGTGFQTASGQERGIESRGNEQPGRTRGGKKNLGVCEGQ